MKKMYAYIAAGAMIFSSLIISEGCTKDTDDDDDLVGNWKKSSDFDGNARSEAVSFVIGDSVYLTTGTTDRDRFKDLWVYSLSRQYWSQRADLPGVARNSAIGFAIGTKGYVGTGYDGSNKLNDFWEYNPASNSWTQKADFTGGGRYEASAFAVNNMGYVTCGFDGNYLKDLYQYNPVTNLWTQKASIGGSKRSAAMTFVLNNQAYVCSGTNNGAALNDLWVYDSGLDTWTERRKVSNATDDEYDDDYAIPRSNGVAFVLGDYAYISLGENSSMLADTWEYHPADDIWVQKTSFESTTRIGAAAFTVNSRAFILTGRSGSISFDNMYEFQPFAEQEDSDN